jgi:hypothetical protein
MSILGALKQHNGSIDDLAKLPQTMIMQMAQKKEISADMVAPILARKAEMMDAVARTKTMQQPEQAPPSVLEQLIAKNTSTEHPQMQMPMQSPMQGPMPQSPEQVGVGQLPVPERQYAGGGIVAFKQGGDLLDEEDDINDEDLIAEYEDAMKAGQLAMMQQGAAQSNTGIKYSEPMPSGASKGITYQGGNHPYESMVMAKAKEHGVDPKLAAYILNKETGGMKNPENALSPAGAMGIAQFMPATAKQYGINPNIPEEAAMGMSKHLRHLMDKYEDPKLAAIAYNWGEGNTNKWIKAGADMEKLPKETKKYVASLAEGGEIRKYAGPYGSVVGLGGRSSGPQEDDEEDVKPSGHGKTRGKALSLGEVISNVFPSSSQRNKPYKGEKGIALQGSYLPNADPMLDNRDVGIPVPKSAYIPNSNPNMDNRDVGERQAAPMNAPVVAPQTATPQESYWDKVMAQMGQERADLGKQKTEDRNMALLAAGLGMMGGTSSNAFTNIGQGGLSGMSYLADANKQRAAQSAALSKNELIAQRYKELGETAKGSQAGMMAIKQGQLAVDQGNLNEKERAHNMGALAQLEKNSQTRALAALKIDAMAPLDPNTQAKINQWVAQDLASKKEYNKLYQDTYGFAYDVAPSTTAGANVIRYDSKGKEIK